jgi:hypothetical protein
LTPFGHRIMPVLARVQPGFALRLNPGEVEDTFEVPLAFLMSPQNYTSENRDWNGLTLSLHTIRFGERSGARPRAYFGICTKRCADGDRAIVEIARAHSRRRWTGWRGSPVHTARARRRGDRIIAPQGTPGAAPAHNRPVFLQHRTYLVTAGTAVSCHNRRAVAMLALLRLTRHWQCGRSCLCRSSQVSCDSHGPRV